MRKISLIILMSLGAAAAAFAATPADGISVSTDPAKIAAVERHAQELKSHQAAHASAGPAAHHTGSAKSKAHTQKSAHAKPKASTTRHTPGAKG